jgi:hypothetical protein
VAVHSPLDGASDALELGVASLVSTPAGSLFPRFTAGVVPLQNAETSFCADVGCARADGCRMRTRRVRPSAVARLHARRKVSWAPAVASDQGRPGGQLLVTRSPSGG